MKKLLTLCTLAFTAVLLSSDFCIAQVNLNKDLVLYYPFDGNAKDASGHGHDGTIINATLTTDRYGHANKAYSFNGKQGINTALSNIGIPAGATMSCWMKTTTTDPAIQVLWGVPGTIYLNLFKTGYYVGVFDGAGYSHSASDDCKTQLNNGDWINITTTNDGYTTKVYVDGVLENSYSETPLPTSVGFSVSNYNAGYGTAFTGSIDDVRLYFRQLSDSEVMALYEAPYVSFSAPSGCLGDTVSFLDSSLATDGSKYSWDFGDKSTSASPNPSHVYTNAGTYKVLLTITTPLGATDTMSKTIVINPKPLVPIITQNGSMLLTGSGTSYQWDLNGSTIKGANLAYYAPSVNNGSFTVTITNKYGCSATSDPYKYGASGIDNLLENYHISIFPNPAHENLNIDLSASSIQVQTIQLTDISGKLLKTIDVVGGQSNIDIPVSNFAKGVYFVRLTASDSSLIQKIIIE